MLLIGFYLLHLYMALFHPPPPQTDHSPSTARRLIPSGQFASTTGTVIAPPRRRANLATNVAFLPERPSGPAGKAPPVQYADILELLHVKNE